MKDARLFIRTSEQQAEELQNIAEIIEVSYSQIVREAIAEKLEKLKATHPKLREQQQVEPFRQAA